MDISKIMDPARSSGVSVEVEMRAKALGYAIEIAKLNTRGDAFDLLPLADALLSWMVGEAPVNG